MAGRVLVTSPAGYLGKHVINSFLNAGYAVRAGLRSSDESHQSDPQGEYASIKATFDAPMADGRLELKTLKSFCPAECWEEALTSGPPVDTVVYLPSILYLKRFNFETGTLKGGRSPVQNRILDALAAVKQYAPSVKRVVAYSQLANIVNQHTGDDKGKVYTEEDWSSANNKSENVNTNREIERASWAFEKPGFDMVTLHTPTLIGPVMPGTVTGSRSTLPREIVELCEKVLAVGYTEDTPVPRETRQLQGIAYVDVRDVAEAAVKAATVTEAGGKRFILCAEQGHMTRQRLLNFFREFLPELRDRIPRGEPDQWQVSDPPCVISSARSKEVLGMQYRNPSDTIRDLALQVAEFLESYPEIFKRWGRHRRNEA